MNPRVLTGMAYCPVSKRNLSDPPVTLPSCLAVVPGKHIWTSVCRYWASTRSGTVSSSGTSTAASVSTSTSTTSGQSSPTATGSLSLSWVAPVARADGTPLSLADIDGFHIYYGNKPGNYPNRVKVTDVTAQRATLKNLASGTYYVVMTTYDVDGRESRRSGTVKKTAS
jgi:hypothetical protein